MASIVGVRGVVDSESVAVGVSPYWRFLRWGVWIIALVLAQYLRYGMAGGWVFEWLSLSTITLLSFGVGLWACGYTFGHGLTLIGLGLLPVCLSATHGLLPLWSQDVPIVAVVGAPIVVILTFFLTRKAIVSETAGISTLATRNFYLLLLAVVCVLVAKSQLPQPGSLRSVSGGTVLQQFIHQSNQLNAYAKLQASFDICAITLTLQGVIAAIPGWRSKSNAPRMKSEQVTTPASAWKFALYFAGVAVGVTLLRPVIESVAFASLTWIIPEHLIETEYYRSVRDLAGIVAILIGFPLLILGGLPLRKCITGWQRFAIPVAAGTILAFSVENMMSMALSHMKVDLDIKIYTAILIVVQLLNGLLVTLFLMQFSRHRLALLLMIAGVFVTTTLLLIWLDPQITEVASRLADWAVPGRSGGVLSRRIVEITQLMVTAPAMIAMGFVVWISLRWGAKRASAPTGLE